MGSAAYRRGSQLVQRQLATTMPTRLLRDIADLNALPKYPDAGRFWSAMPLTLTYAAHQHCWWLEGPDGPAGYGLMYRTLREAVRRWHLTITGYDATTGIWHAEPTPGEPV